MYSCHYYTVVVARNSIAYTPGASGSWLGREGFVDHIPKVMPTTVLCANDEVTRDPFVSLNLPFIHTRFKDSSTN